MGKSVADGKKAVADAISAMGTSTAADASFATLASNVTSMGNSRYTNGYNAGYPAGVTAAFNDVTSVQATSSPLYNSGRDSMMRNILNAQFTEITRSSGVTETILNNIKVGEYISVCIISFEMFVDDGSSPKIFVKHKTDSSYRGVNWRLKIGECNSIYIKDNEHASRNMGSLGVMYISTFKIMGKENTSSHIPNLMLDNSSGLVLPLLSSSVSSATYDCTDVVRIFAFFI